MGCASSAPVTQPTEPTAREVVTNTVPTVSGPPKTAVVTPAEPTATASVVSDVSVPEPAATAEVPRAPVRTVMSGVDITEPEGATLLEERIAAADVVVRAEVKSVTQAVDSFKILAYGGFQPAVYAKSLVYTLTVNEYLKGSGSNEIEAVVIDFFERHPTSAAATASTTDYLSHRAIAPERHGVDGPSASRL